MTQSMVKVECSGCSGSGVYTDEAIQRDMGEHVGVKCQQCLGKGYVEMKQFAERRRRVGISVVCVHAHHYHTNHPGFRHRQYGSRISIEDFLSGSEPPAIREVDLVRDD